MKSDEELERKLFSPVPEEVELYTRRLEEMAKKTFENPRESLALHIDTEIPVGRLPHVLYEMGFPLGDVKLHYGVFYKIDGKKHAMPSSFLRNLPDYVSDPYFIVKSKSIDMGDKVDSLLLVSEDRIDGKPISVALALAPMRTKLGYYIIPTVYEHDLISANDTNYFKRWIESKSLVYSRKEMIKWGDEEIKISGRHLKPLPRYNTGLLRNFQPLPMDNVLLKRDVVNLYATAGKFTVLLSGSRLDQKKAWDEYKVAEAYLKERGFRTLNPCESLTKGRKVVEEARKDPDLIVARIPTRTGTSLFEGREDQLFPGVPVLKLTELLPRRNFSVENFRKAYKDKASMILSL